MTNPTNFRLDNEDGPLSFNQKDAELDIYRGPNAKEGQFILAQTFITEWGVDDVTYRLRIPQGYITDVASVPRVAWSVITPDGWHRNGALNHDGLYTWQGEMPSGWFQKKDEAGNWVDVLNEDGKPAKWSKNDCDRFFLRTMKACGVSKARRFLMYWAVNMFGWPAWWRTDPSREKYRNAFISS